MKIKVSFICVHFKMVDKCLFVHAVLFSHLNIQNFEVLKHSSEVKVLANFIFLLFKKYIVHI